jgi:hypothetical protein
LVYFEIFEHPSAAIRREKQIKGWLRSKKIALIRAHNPTWGDLAASWFAEPERKGRSKADPSLLTPAHQNAPGTPIRSG